MDNITHTLFALTLANAGVGRNTRGATAALVLSSNAPDIDIVTAFVAGPADYLAAHRGPTHGPIGLVTLALVTAALVSFWTSAEERTANAFRRLTGIATVGVLCHVAMDYPTSYFTRLWEPFSHRWSGADWLPIVDVYLLAVLIAGLMCAYRWLPYRRQAAIAALLLMLANYAARATLHAAALREARAVPAIDAAAIPTFGSPFRWRLIRRFDDRYELSEFDLLNRSQAGRARSIPNARDEWTARAATAPTARVFLNFARYPVARTIKEPDGTVTVRWTDVRFFENRLFIATVRLSRDGAILSDTIAGDSVRPRE